MVTTMTAAQEAAESWLTLIDTAQYEQSWRTAASFFRNSITEPAWVGAVRQARQGIDPLSGRTLLSASFETTLPNAPRGDYVVMQYRTITAGGKVVVETVTPMREADGSWGVAGYFIRPS